MENSEILDKLYIQREALLKQIEGLLKQTEATNNAIIGFGGRVPSNFIPINKNMLEIISENKITTDYPFKGTYEAKILYILESQGAMSATSIAAFIIKKENIKDAEQLRILLGNVTMICSTMFNKGKILADKDGKKNIYKFKRA